MLRRATRSITDASTPFAIRRAQRHSRRRAGEGGSEIGRVPFFRRGRQYIQRSRLDQRAVAPRRAALHRRRPAVLGHRRPTAGVASRRPGSRQLDHRGRGPVDPRCVPDARARLGRRSQCPQRQAVRAVLITADPVPPAPTTPNAEVGDDAPGPPHQMRECCAEFSVADHFAESDSDRAAGRFIWKCPIECRVVVDVMAPPIVIARESG